MTGLMVSEIGYGAEQLVDKPYEQVDAVVNTSLDGGVNIIDIEDDRGDPLPGVVVFTSEHG
jgi:predicted oxidoreductase